MSYERILKLPTHHSFFLFGPRGTGKSTLLDDLKSKLFNLNTPKNILFLDLLNPKTEDIYSLNPSRLIEELSDSSSQIQWCIIDEVQKIPTLLDVAQWAIQKKKIKFAFTGSSARKLKRGKANLLAGRAFDLKLHPLTKYELKEDFNLEQVLQYGSLPEVFSFSNEVDKTRFLEAYTRTYLKEEIQLEQIVRRMQSFRRFLPFAAQMNTKILNFSKLSATSGIDEKSINRYFEILEDTLLCIFLEPYYKSIRKRQKLKPKFYLFDTGIVCQMREDFQGKLISSSSIFGELFEQWFILECHRLRDYFEINDQFYYLNTKDGAEIDFIIERRGMAPLFIEIKSTEHVTEDCLRHLRAFKKTTKASRSIVVCREKRPRLTEDGIEILPYSTALEELYPPR